MFVLGCLCFPHLKFLWEQLEATCLLYREPTLSSKESYYFVFYGCSLETWLWAMTLEKNGQALHSGTFQTECISTLRAQGGSPHPTMTTKYWQKDLAISKIQTRAGKHWGYLGFINRKLQDNWWREITTLRSTHIENEFRMNLIWFLLFFKQFLTVLSSASVLLSSDSLDSPLCSLSPSSSPQDAAQVPPYT